VVKVSKQKLIIEEVEQFDKISIEDLVEGVFVHVGSDFLALSVDLVQNYPKTLRGLWSCHTSTTTQMGGSPFHSCSSTGLPKPQR
jgi:hypothetical protein